MQVAGLLGEKGFNRFYTAMKTVNFQTNLLGKCGHCFCLDLRLVTQEGTQACNFKPHRKHTAGKLQVLVANLVLLLNCYRLKVPSEHVGSRPWTNATTLTLNDRSFSLLWIWSPTAALSAENKGRISVHTSPSPPPRLRKPLGTWGGKNARAGK